MCMFCASAPVVLAAGAQLEAKQRRSRQEAITGKHNAIPKLLHRT